FSRLLDGLKDSLGFLFDAQAKPGSVDSHGSSNSPVDRSGADHRAALINLSQMRVRCGLKSMDEVMECIADLEKRGGVVLCWTLAFAGRPLASEHPLWLNALFTSVGDAVEHLIGRLLKRG